MAREHDTPRGVGEVGKDGPRVRNGLKDKTTALITVSQVFSTHECTKVAMDGH